ncbi:hypothetical protein KP509_32G069800 [Ceratopteris richardii]|uniref:IST1-like protein n=1 Tax=Ceratopteris richardii TaxID=49495 RepID=A0A8T2QW02_CERRI|nr:hypothetical protein KP509_32G069800 [Ceratopteris richardii]
MSSLFRKNDFHVSKCLSLLKTIQQHVDVVRKKRLVVARQCRDDVAKLIQRGQIEHAARRVAYMLKEENRANAYELLEGYCELVIKDIRFIKSEKECPAELKEAIAGLVYATSKCGELQELQKLRDMFISRFGHEYVDAIIDLRPGSAVNRQIIQNFSSSPPSSHIKLNLLKEIAQEYKLDWTPQRPDAASFKAEDISEKQKISLSTNQASEKDLHHYQELSIPNNSKPKEPAEKVCSENAVFATKTRVDQSKLPNQRGNIESTHLSGNFTVKSKRVEQSSTTDHSAAELITHGTRPEQRDVAEQNKHQVCVDMERASLTGVQGQSSSLVNSKERSKGYSDLGTVKSSLLTSSGNCGTHTSNGVVGRADLKSSLNDWHRDQNNEHDFGPVKAKYEHNKPSMQQETIFNERSSVSSELMSVKMEIDEELEELEQAIKEAAHSANVAMEMLRTRSPKSRMHTRVARQHLGINVSSLASGDEIKSTKSFQNPITHTELENGFGYTEHFQVLKMMT